MDYDDAYNNVNYIPGGQGYLDAWEAEGAEYRALEATLGRARLNTTYGDDPRQMLDLFHPAGPPAGVIFFVHGGYWRMLGREYFAHLAEGAREAGWAMAMPSYRLVPDVPLSDIVSDIRTALVRVAEMTKGPIVLSGHSAGGHLVARMLMADVGLPLGVTSRLRRVVPISPLSDLRPLMKTSMNADFKLTEENAAAESPALHPKLREVPVHVWVGAAERPAFVDQARWLAAAWDAELTEEPKRHHYNVIDGLKSPKSALFQALLT